MSVARGVRTVGVLAVLAGAVPLPARRLGPLDPSQISPERGHAFLAHGEGANWALGPSEAEGGSSLKMLEDDRPLSSKHGHDDIRQLGGGRFSHWGPQIYFSSTDNSDPRVNGRSYVVLVPRSLLGLFVGESRAPSWRQFLLLIGATLFTVSFAGSRSRLRTAAQVGGVAGAALVSWLSLPVALWALSGVAIVFWTSKGSTGRFVLVAGLEKRRLGTALVAVAALAISVLHLRALATTPVGWDEGILLAQTEGLLQGQRLYTDVMTQYPPGIYTVLEPALRLRHGLATARGVAALVHLGIALFAALIAHRLSGNLVAPFTTAGLWLACATAFEADTLMSDPFSTLPAMAALLCLAMKAGPPSRGRSVAAGALLAAGALCKQMGALWAISAVLWLVAQPEAFVKRLSRIAWLVAGGAFVALPVLVGLAGRPRALFCTLVFPLSERYPAETSLALLRDTLTPERWTIALMGLLLAVVASLLRPPPRFRGGPEVLLWLTVLFSLVPLAKRSYAHYWLPALAALSALAGAGAGRLRAKLEGGGNSLTVALWMAAGLGLVLHAAERVSATHTVDGLRTRLDDTSLVLRLRAMAPVGAEVVSTWPFATFANRYRSPLRFHYDLGFTVPGDYWLEEWRDLGRRAAPANLLIARSRRNVYDMAPVIWRQIAPDQPLQPSAEPELLRPLHLPPLLWYAGREGQDLQLALAGPPAGPLVLHGVTDTDEVVFSRDWGESERAAVRPGEPFELRFDGPRDTWRLARASVEKGRNVRWDRVERSPP